MFKWGRLIKMALELHSNDASREAKPSVFIFHGKSVALLVIGAAAFLVLFQILAKTGLDWWVVIPLSLLPLLAMTLFVHFLINGKPKSYASDLLAFAAWRLRCRFYFWGLLERPPELWMPDRKPAHPSQFIKEAS
jgi:hypothetical protein